MQCFALCTPKDKYVMVKTIKPHTSPGFALETNVSPPHSVDGKQYSASSLRKRCLWENLELGLWWMRLMEFEFRCVFDLCRLVCGGEGDGTGLSFIVRFVCWEIAGVCFGFCWVFASYVWSRFDENGLKMENEGRCLECPK
jgi:hypothetical protein